MINIQKIKQMIEKEDEGLILEYKEDLVLETEGDKAEFVKDIVSLANNGEVAHIITGVEDITRKLVDIKTSHKAEQLNDVLIGKCDPNLTVEYAEKNILGHSVGIVELKGNNRPYVISVHDRYGGRPSNNPTKECYIYRGIVYTRNFNKNEGASRADLDKMYGIRYVEMQTELQLTHEVSVKAIEGSKEVAIKFRIHNTGDLLATSPYARIVLNNIEKIVDSGCWEDISAFNENIPTLRIVSSVPICPEIALVTTPELRVKVAENIDYIDAYFWLGAANMRVKKGPYLIVL